MSILSILQLILAFVFIIFVPGLILTFIFFPRSKPASQDIQDTTRFTQLDWLERILLSMGFSLAGVPLVLFLLNWLGVRITQMSIVVSISLLILLELAYLGTKYYFKKSKQ
jgi:uncharacterized membrane protein